MALDLVNGGIGLAVGLATGYFFERRATRSAQAHATDLERELESLRRSVYTMGASPQPTERAVTDIGSLADAVKQRALAVQNPAGRVSKAHLISHFVERGHDHGQIVDAIGYLCSTGALRDHGTELEMIV